MCGRRSRPRADHPLAVVPAAAHFSGVQISRSPSMNIEELPHVTGEITYLARMAERAHTYAYDLPPDQPRTNMRPDNRKVPIYDMRPIADMSLDREGFALIDAPTEAGELCVVETRPEAYSP